MTNNSGVTLQQALSKAIQYHRASQFPQALKIYQQILQQRSDLPDVWNLYGLLASQTGDHKLAVDRLRKAVSLNANFAEAHYNLANAYSALEDSHSAIKHFTSALDLKPEFDEIRLNLIAEYETLGELETAIEHYHLLIKAKPDTALYHYNLGNLYRRLGQFDNAIKQYKLAIAINPAYGEAYRQFLAIIKPQSYDNTIKKAEQLFAAITTKNEDKMHLAFGLGKVFEDIQQYKKAFQLLQHANKLRRLNFNYNSQSWQRYVDQLIDSFQPEFMRQLGTVENDNKTPLFIVGMPRSGTSLVEQILASHSQVFGAGEVKTLNQILASTINMANLPQEVKSLTSEQLRRLGADYSQKLSQKSSTHRYISDKMTGNFIHIGMIKLMFPNAKIIHCVRHPLDNCLSIFKNYFHSNGHHYAYDLEEIAQYYLHYHRLMDHWHQLLPGFVHDIHYESLVSAPDEKIHALLNFCDLQWQDNCLDFYKNKREVKTASAVQVRQPLHSGSVELWRQYETELAPVSKVLSNILSC